MVQRIERVRVRNKGDIFRFDDELEELDEEWAEMSRGKTRQSRPPRSVLYYLKAYESTISLTPVQLPPRSRILQVTQIKDILKNNCKRPLLVK